MWKKLSPKWCWINSWGVIKWNHHHLVILLNKIILRTVEHCSFSLIFIITILSKITGFMNPFQIRVISKILLTYSIKSLKNLFSISQSDTLIFRRRIKFRKDSTFKIFVSFSWKSFYSIHMFSLLYSLCLTDDNLKYFRSLFIAMYAMGY